VQSKRPSLADPVVLAAVGLLVVVSVLGNAVAPRGYILWSVLGAGGLALLARRDGLQPAQWGLGPLRRRVAFVALGLLVATSAVVSAVSQVPAVADAFVDDRVVGLTGAQVAYLAFLRVPFGTVLIEEVAFRGVLLAILGQRLPVWGAVALSSLAFGVWHVLPILYVAPGNAAMAGAFASSRVLAVLAGVLASALVGAAFCWLRLRFDHLIAPMAVHAGANATAYWVAWQAVSS
jgi:membrane protease YdiL (CAAX protease family)